jgi:hypothetical protein
MSKIRNTEICDANIFLLFGRPSRRAFDLCFDLTGCVSFLAFGSQPATPEKIFPLIDNPRAMNEWNPFVKSDPNIKLTYSGPPNGVGAANDFEGDSRIGAGRAEIVESAPPLRVVVALRMDRPMKCQNRVEFRIAPRDGGADVTWAMTGNPFRENCSVSSSIPKKWSATHLNRALQISKPEPRHDFKRDIGQ